VTQRRTVPPGARGRRLANTPLVSLVVASTGPVDRLRHCLARLIPLAQEHGVELVVCRKGGMDEYRELTETYPSVLFMPAGDDVTHAQARGVGLSATEGDVVAVLDDTDELDPAWLKRILTPADARGEADQPRLDWASWFAAKNVELP